MNKLRSLILASALFASLAPAFAQAPPPVPALPDTERRTSYSISASTCACAVGFQLFGDSTDYTNWIEVWVNGVRITQSGNWTITSPTGSLATIPRPITDAVLTFTAAQTGTIQIVGAQRPRRTSQFAENRGVAARDLNQVISALTAQLRENWDKTNDVTGRAVIAPPGETLAMLPKLASRLSQGACFDSSGNLTTCVSVPSTTFAAGAGITFTGSAPTTIAANLSASLPIVMSGTSPIQFSCPTCGTVIGSGTPTAGDLTTFSTAATTPITSPGYNIKQVPGAIPTTSTVLISNASPGVITWTSHGLLANAPVWFCNSGGALPTGLTPCVPATGAVSANTYLSNPTLYYVVGSSITANTFTVATSIANAKAGTAVNTSSAGSGTHTAFANGMACAGCVGEYIYNTVVIASAVPLTTGSAGVAFNSISLTPGIWWVGQRGGVIGLTGTAAFTHAHFGVVYGFTTVPSAPFNGITAMHVSSNQQNGWIVTNDPEQIFLTTTTTLNGVVTSDFTGGTAGAYGRIWARRAF